VSERPVPASWIEEVRSRLAAPAPRRLAPGEQREAAVLVPLFVDAGELWTLLTRRAEHLAKHRGQVAFAGGGLELGEDAWTGALREAEEELGLPRESVLVLGQLDEVEAPTGYRIVPCVGAVPSQLQLTPDPGEIAEVYRVPLRALADPRLVEDRRIVFNGVPRQVRVYHFGAIQIWGVTARIVQALLARLGMPMSDPGDEPS
jgi:8-oxo-dGTP pyrophosphatase MutT (NUDIX family)